MVGDRQQEPGTVQDKPYTGRPLARREDPDLVTGQGRFVDDIAIPGALHLAFFRSPYRHGRIVGCDLAAARRMPGVVTVLAGADLPETGTLSVNPALGEFDPLPFELLAVHRVRAAGQPVAAVLADTSDRARDAAAAIWLDVTGDQDAGAGTVIAARHWHLGDPDAAFAGAAHVVHESVRHPRLAPAPLETRAIAVDYDPHDDCAHVWLSTQTPHRARRELAKILRLAPDRLRVTAPDVGGAFGMKASLYPEEVLAVWSAFHLRRPVRWSATRSEDFLSATHGRGLSTSGQLAVSAQGRFLALRATVQAPLGHWLPSSAMIPGWNAGRILPGPYDVEALDVRATAAAEATAPVGIYRGAGRPEACMLMERLADAAARATGIDRLEIRRRNLNPSARPGGRTINAAALDLLADRAGYGRALADRDARRDNGELAGVGLGLYVEPSGQGHESARVTLTGDGRVIVATGGSSQGHGRETALSQVAADLLSVDPGAVSVVHGDTADCPEGIGALASRSTPIGASAVHAACAAIAARRASGEAAPISEQIVYTAPAEAWGHGCYMIALVVDRDTGAIAITRAACVDDAGRLINPMLAEGQIRGGFAQGFGEAISEALVYEDGQLATGSLMDYAMPRAADLPTLSIFKTQTPNRANLLGAAGLGEAGTIGAPAAILNAARDALSPLGVDDLQMPLTPLRLWQAITTAGARAGRPD